MGTDRIRPTLFISTRSVRRRKDIYLKILKIIGNNISAPSIATKPHCIPVQKVRMELSKEEEGDCEKGSG